MRRTHADSTQTGIPVVHPLESPTKKARSKHKSEWNTKTKKRLSSERQRQAEERGTLVEFRVKNDAEGALTWYKNKKIQSAERSLDSSMYALLLSILADNMTEFLLDSTLAVYEDMKERGFCTEATESLLIRAFCKGDHPSQAEAVVKAMESRGEELRIRTVMPLLECYSRLVSQHAGLENLENVRRMYAAMKRAVVAKDEDFEVDTFCMVLKGLAGCRRNGDVHAKVEAENVGSLCLADVANYVRLGDEKLTACIKEWIDTLGQNWSEQSGCAVGDDGTCEGCGQVLHARELAKEQEWELASTTEKFVLNAGKKATVPWNAFKRWVQERGKQGGYDCVVDVANVAYYQSNAVNAKLQFDFGAVKRVVDLLEEQGRKCLLIMHESHLGKRDCRTPQDHAIIQEWRSKEVLFTVPRGLLDDWFWLYATMVQGDRTLILSNDWMRDHHFLMLKQREFQRWREQRQVRFQLVPASGGQEPAKPVLQFPTVFTRRVQVECENDITLITKGTYRIKRGAYLPNGTLKSIHVPMCTKQIRRTKKGKPLPYVSDIPRPDELSWHCFHKVG